MTALTNGLHAVDSKLQSRQLRRQLLEMHPLPLLLAEVQAEAQHQQRTLLHLQGLLRDTPLWCIRQRCLIRHAIASCQPAMWS